MFEKGDRVYVKENPGKPATVVDTSWKIHVVFDDPSVYPGPWFSYATSLVLIDRSSDFEVDE